MRGKAAYLLYGPPGAGKGTLAQQCAQRFCWAVLSTGALCRKHIIEQTEVGKQIDFIVKSGKLIPDELITGLVDGWISKQKEARVLILDGFPRSVLQVYHLCRLIRTKYSSLQLHVIKLAVNDDIVKSRLDNRLVCANCRCQAVYAAKGTELLVARSPEICDFCGSPLFTRSDDKPSVVKERLAAYYKHDLTETFISVGLPIKKLEAGRPAEDVFNDFGCLARRYK